MNWWRAVGLAGVAGVAATGVVLARRERQRRAYTPEDVRARLHGRLDAPADDPARGAERPPDGGAGGTSGRTRA